MINSLHLSKFSDLDEDGKEILFPMLTELGVDTIVIIGAWTDDCVLATVVEGVDRYGFDIVVVEDAVGTQTLGQGITLEVIRTCFGLVPTTEELLTYMGVAQPTEKRVKVPPHVPVLQAPEPSMVSMSGALVACAFTAVASSIFTLLGVSYLNKQPLKRQAYVSVPDVATSGTVREVHAAL